MLKKMLVLKKKFILIVFVVFIFLGFFVAALSPSSGRITSMYCDCSHGLEERPCNDWGHTDPIFSTGLINVIMGCPGKEIIICENNEQVDTRHDIYYEECGYTFYVFNFRL